MDLFSVLLSILIGGLIIFLIHQMTYWSRRGVPHLPTIPIIGNRFSILSFIEVTIMDWMLDIYSKIPEAKYVGAMMFNTPVIILRDPELIRDICLKNFDSAPDHRSFIDERMDPIFGKNVFSLKGDRWRQVRSALSPSFTASKMKYLFELISKVSEDFIQYLNDHPEICELLDTKDAFSRYTNDVIATSAFGIDVNSMKERENEFYLKGKDASSFSGLVKIIKFFAGFFFPRLCRLLGIRFLSNDTNDFFIKLIHDTVNLREKNGIERPDMIHLLMQARDTAKFEMNIDDIVAQSFIFFLAGFDTSSTALMIIIHHLSHYPEVQDRLRDEVDGVLRDGEFTYQSLSQMKYMDMVINESLRIYTPSVLLDRIVVKPIELPPATPDAKKVTINPGSAFWIPIYAIQKDPKYFPDPDEFNPDRFADESNITPYTFSPFGLGPRKCIGERFALMEIKLILARLIHQFNITPSEKSTKKLSFDSQSLNLVPKGGVWVKLEKRK